ncbi:MULTISPECIES: hypothetical protein [unclassified Devosia]|uniref:hypothetical protein n=1 Tax=unclassified Devosia TaxID=196773 RepID=UPI0015553142|nr:MULTISPECIES: hypothetical protein [unclassified Devosia]
MSFEIKACDILYFEPHRIIKGRTVGVIRVKVRETFMGAVSEFSLDLKCRADIGRAQAAEIRTALLAHAAHQLNRIKARHEQMEADELAASEAMAAATAEPSGRAQGRLR